MNRLWRMGFISLLSVSAYAANVHVQRRSESPESATSVAGPLETGGGRGGGVSMGETVSVQPSAPVRVVPSSRENRGWGRQNHGYSATHPGASNYAPAGRTNSHGR